MYALGRQWSTKHIFLTLLVAIVIVQGAMLTMLLNGNQAVAITCGGIVAPVTKINDVALAGTTISSAVTLEVDIMDAGSGIATNSVEFLIASDEKVIAVGKLAIGTTPGAATVWRAVFDPTLTSSGSMSIIAKATFSDTTVCTSTTSAAVTVSNASPLNPILNIVNNPTMLGVYTALPATGGQSATIYGWLGSDYTFNVNTLQEYGKYTWHSDLGTFTYPYGSSKKYHAIAYTSPTTGSDVITLHLEYGGRIFQTQLPLPPITLNSYTTAPTNQNITVTATAPTGFSFTTASSNTFTSNGPFTFYAKDDATNTITIYKTVQITNIDKAPPIITVGYYDATTPTRSLTVTASLNEAGTLNATTYTFTANGLFTFTATDTAGNIALEKTVAITNIDRTKPIINIGSYNTSTPTNQNITVTASLNEAGTLNATSHTYTENGSFTFTGADTAGNTAISKTITISNIDKVAPVVCLIGIASVEVQSDEEYIEYGAAILEENSTCTVASSKVAIGGDTVSNGVTGIYTVTYNYSDAAGNPASQVSRTVHVLPPTAIVSASAATSTTGTTGTTSGTTGTTSTTSGTTSSTSSTGGTTGTTSTTSGTTSSITSTTSTVVTQTAETIADRPVTVSVEANCIVAAIGQERFTAITTSSAVATTAELEKIDKCLGKANNILPTALVPIKDEESVKQLENSESLSIENIVNDTKEVKGQPITVIVLRGKSTPNSTILLYIFSEPLVMTTTTDGEGNWSYTLENPLSPGEHEVYAVVDEGDGQYKKSSPFSFIIGRAEASAENPDGYSLKLESATPPQDRSSLVLYMVIIGCVFLAALAFFVVYIIKRNKKARFGGGSSASTNPPTITTPTTPSPPILMNPAG